MDDVVVVVIVIVVVVVEQEIDVAHLIHCAASEVVVVSDGGFVVDLVVGATNDPNRPHRTNLKARKVHST